VHDEPGRCIVQVSPARRPELKRFFAYVAGSVLLVSCALASAVGEDVGLYRDAHEKEILEEFLSILSLRNVATSVADIETNAVAITSALRRRGFTTRLLAAQPGTPPAVFGELKVAGALRTVLFYAHYDGQPASQPEWRSEPWAPVIRAGARAADSLDVNWRLARRIDPEWRIYARSASDDKAPIQAMLTALDALRSSGRRPSVNIKVFYEGEEERGSTHLTDILRINRALLAADVFVLSDGPRHPSGKMQVFFGARGLSSLELTVYGPLRPLHSGHFGNWAPNPAVMLTELLHGLRDENGRILIPGFYDDVRPLSPEEIAALAGLPNTEDALKSELALARTEGAERLAESVARPALNLRGIRVGDVGPLAANVISTDARASIDFRLVPDQTPAEVRQRTEAYLRSQGWDIVTQDPDTAIRRMHAKLVKAEWSLDYPGYRTSMESPAAKAIVACIERVTEAPVVRMPTLGGSVPMHLFDEFLDMPIIGVPIANYDNNQHGANENLRVQNLWDGIDIYVGLLTNLRW
jgi:acetylornithine deacetylase/succinyl-diaminopimelate desuccinylase-like protein